jgi:hypothetical protein
MFSIGPLLMNLITFTLYTRRKGDALFFSSTCQKLKDKIIKGAYLQQCNFLVPTAEKGLETSAIEINYRDNRRLNQISIEIYNQ